MQGTNGRRGRWQAAIPRDAPVALLAGAALVSAVWLLRLDSQLTFVADDWMLLVKRQGWSLDYFLHPFHGNVVAGPALAYKLMREVFGMGSATPYYAVAIACFVASAILLFAYLRRRVGDWLALLAATLVLFLGAAFEDLLFAFQIGYFAGAVTGLGALLALDREDERGDLIACGLLTISVFFSSVGIAFAAGAVVDLALGRKPRLRRYYVAFVPIALYLVWWLGWGHEAQQHVSWHNFVTTPEFVFKAASAGIVSPMGLATGDGSEPSQPHLIWGQILLVVGAILLIVQAVKRGGISRGLGVALAIGLTFWILAGVNRDVSRLPTSSRFQYPSAIFILLIAGEMLRGVRIPRAVIAVAAIGTGAAVVGGVSLLEREHEERWVPYADSLRSSLAAVEIAGPRAEPGFPVFFPPDIKAPAHAYLTTVEEYGSPAFSEEDLAGRPGSERASADLTIAQALGLALLPPDPTRRVRACQVLKATADGIPASPCCAGASPSPTKAKPTSRSC